MTTTLTTARWADPRIRRVGAAMVGAFLSVSAGIFIAMAGVAIEAATMAGLGVGTIGAGVITGARTWRAWLLAFLLVFLAQVALGLAIAVVATRWM